MVFFKFLSRHFLRRWNGLLSLVRGFSALSGTSLLCITISHVLHYLRHCRSTPYSPLICTLICYIWTYLSLSFSLDHADYVSSCHYATTPMTVLQLTCCVCTFWWVFPHLPNSEHGFLDTSHSTTPYHWRDLRAVIFSPNTLGIPWYIPFLLLLRFILNILYLLSLVSLLLHIWLCLQSINVIINAWQWILPSHAFHKWFPTHS